MTEDNATSLDWAQLRQSLIESFDDNELRDLCFDLRIDYESLPGEGKSAKARELVTYCERHKRLDELHEAIRQAEARHAAHAARRTCHSTLPTLPYFFGREKELATIADAISPEARTWGALIDGPGGIGKTALAIRAGHAASTEQFEFKLFLSAKVRELTPQGEQPLEDFMLPNYMALLAELACALGEDGIAKIDPNERAKSVTRALADRRALLVIDNLETFEEKERVRVFQFLGRLPAACKAIVTSRRRADVDARAIRLDRLAPSEALELMAALAHGSRNRHLARATEGERQDLYEITNGNPLLIKWTVGQLGRGHCRTVAEACAFLRAAPKDNDPLEFIFGDLLETFTASETAVLAALTHFTQPAQVEWIAELAGLAEREAQTALEDLADRALLVADPEAKMFALPPLAAHFIRNKRPEAVAQTANRLTDRAYALAMENGRKNFERFPVLEAEWPTIEAALPLFLQGPNDRLQRLCDALVSFLKSSKRLDELLSLYQQSEVKALAADNFHDAGARAYWAGWVYSLRGQAKDVLDCATRCEAHWGKDAQSGMWEKAIAIRLRGSGHELEKNYSAAIVAYKESLEELKRTLVPESADLAIVLNDLSRAEQLSGDNAAAERNYREALRIAKKVNYPDGIATYSVNLAALWINQEKWIEAELLMREAVEWAEKVGRQELIGSSCWRLAEVLARQGRPTEGMPYAHRAVQIFEKLRSPKLEDARAVLKACES